MSYHNQVGTIFTAGEGWFRDFGAEKRVGKGVQIFAASRITDGQHTHEIGVRDGDGSERIIGEISDDLTAEQMDDAIAAMLG